MLSPKPEEEPIDDSADCTVDFDTQYNFFGVQPATLNGFLDSLGQLVMMPIGIVYKKAKEVAKETLSSDEVEQMHAECKSQEDKDALFAKISPDESQCIELVFRDAIFYIFALTDLLHHILQGVNNRARVILLAREKHLIAYNQDVSNREKFQHLEEMQAKDRILAVLMKEGGDMAKQLQLEADKNEMKEKEATKREAHMRRL